jgi:hypothetical protein
VSIPGDRPTGHGDSPPRRVVFADGRYSRHASPRRDQPDRNKRGWPHHVAITADEVHDFANMLSVAPRGYHFWRDDIDYAVFCFKEEADANRFRERFGSERVSNRP